MNTKQRNNIGSVKKGSHPNNGGTNHIKHLEEFADNKRAEESELLLRLQKMEELNVQLNDLVEEDKIKLAGVVSTNAKFLSLIAHDLRNPLSTAIGVLDLLNEHFDDYEKSETEKLINIASNSAIKTLRLLDNLLAWSISQNKAKSFNPVKINLCELISNEFESFNTSAAQKQIYMGHSVMNNLYVTADQQMVKTIFRNLISNAIKFSKTGDTIFISAKEGKPFVEIEVADNGIGISKKIQKKLFVNNEFHSTSGTNNEQGTGLGLLFCKEFVSIHGGKIWVESEPDKGSKFKFTLPHYI
jgi:signal transduction histidine kinase